MFLSILTTVNLFKVPVQLRINNSSFLSSRPGELLSLTEIETLKTATFSFTPDNFALIVGIASLSAGFTIDLDHRYASFYAEYIVMPSNPLTKNYDVVSFQKLAMPKCVDSLFGRQNSDLLSQYPNAFCLPKTNFSVLGSYAEPTYQFMEVTLEMCNNKTMNNSCKSQAEIDEFISGTFFGFAQTENLFTGEDYEHPFQTKITSKYFSLDSKIRKIYKANLQTMTVVDDDGVVQSNRKAKETWKVGTSDFDIDLNPHIQLASLLYYPTNKGVVYKRTYMKLQEELGSLGGIANIFMGLGLLLMKLSPFGVTQLFLSKQLFSFQSLNKKTEKLSKKKIIKKQKQKRNASLSKNITKETQDITKGNEENQNMQINIGKIRSIVLENPPKLHHKSYSDIEADKIPSFLMNSPLNSPKSLLSPKSHRKNFTSILMNQDLLRSTDIKVKASNKLKPLTGDDPLDHISTNSQPNGPLKRMEENCLIKLKSSSKFAHKKRKSVTQEASFANNFVIFSKSKSQKNEIKLQISDFFDKEKRIFLYKKLKALRIATSKVNKELDIITILQRFQELDKLKLLLFNKDQLMLFNLIAKPEIFIDEKDDVESPGMNISKNLKSLNEVDDQRFLELAIYYNNIKKKQGGDDLDSRLVRLVDEDMKEYLTV